MPKQLVIELDAAEARAMLLSVAGLRVKLEKYLEIALEKEVGERKEYSGEAAAAELNLAVVQSLAREGISHVETIALVGREDVELRLLNLPPAPEAELPEMVRFQAAQEMPALGAKTPLDYLPLDEGRPAGQSQRVLAAVLKPGVMSRLEKICGEAKLTLTSVVLRPAATASLVLREKPELGAGCCLLLEMLDRHMEIAALNRGQVVFLRQVLLAEGADDAAAAEALIAEIRRTRLAAASQEGVEKVEPIVVLGEGADYETFAKILQNSLGADVLPFDPMVSSRAVKIDSQDLANERDTWRDDYCTALVGAAVDEASGRRPAFDFLHPRRPAQPPNRRNTYMLAALCAAVCVLAVIALNWVQNYRFTKDIARIQWQLSSLEPKLKEAEKLVAADEEMQVWLRDEVVWLEELSWLSEKFPPAKDAMLNSFSATAAAGRREMRLGGLARDVDAAGKLDAGLRDDAHQVVGRTKSENSSGGGYGIQFRSSVQIAAPGKKS